MWDRLCIGLLVWLLLGLPVPGHAQSIDPLEENKTFSSILADSFVREKGEKGLDLLYNMRSEEARALFREIDERYPDHPVGPFLQGLNLWWTIMLDLTDASHDEAFFEQMDEVIARCEELLDENPEHFDAMLFKAAAHGFKARLASNRSDWWKAIRNGRKAIGPAREVAETAPSENGDYVFGKGLYDYYTAIIEEEYPVVKTFTWLIPDGNRTLGLEQLRRTAEDGHYVKTEAIYYLTQIYYLYEDNYREARAYVRQLRERHPDNPYFHNYEGRVYAKWGRWKLARDVFTEVLERRENRQPGYNVHMEEIARYYLGRERLRHQAYEEALHHLSKLERLTERDLADNRYRLFCFLYQGMVFDALGRRDHAVQRYRAVLEMDDPVGVHERAERYLEEPYSP